MRRIAAAAVVLAGIAAAPASAAVPGVNGRIAFASDRDGDFEIYSMASDGTGLVRLTTSPGVDGGPDWSPDGDRLAFVSERDGNREIYVMDADGTNPVRLTTNPGVDAAPRWSPDGRRILFQTNRAGNFEISVMNADGSNVQRVTRNAAADQSPAWSPTGEQAAFVSNRDGDPEIFIANTDGTDLRRLTRNTVADSEPSFSPDATTVAYESAVTGGGDVYTVPAEGGTATRLTSSAGRDAFPSFSPDGTRIAFASDRDGNGEIYTMAADGDGETRRTTNAGADGQPAWGRLSASAPPEAGATAVADVVKGTVRIKLRGGEFVNLEETAAIPIGATLDTKKGTLRLVTSDAAGGTQTGDFYEGVFKLTQKKGSALTDLKLAGSSFKGCPRVRRARASKKKKSSSSVRHLWGKSSGKFRTSGKYATATVRGTTWKTDDRCDGTLVRVTDGSVTVRDKARRRNVVVREGRRYLARKRR